MIDKIREILEKVENPGEVEWWDSGNYDDAYAIGKDVGRYELAEELLEILNKGS